MDLKSQEIPLELQCEEVNMEDPDMDPVSSYNNLIMMNICSRNIFFPPRFIIVILKLIFYLVGNFFFHRFNLVISWHALHLVGVVRKEIDSHS
jgi:hypothetical protein